MGKDVVLQLQGIARRVQAYAHFAAQEASITMFVRAGRDFCAFARPGYQLSRLMLARNNSGLGECKLLVATQALCTFIIMRRLARERLLLLKPGSSLAARTVTWKEHMLAASSSSSNSTYSGKAARRPQPRSRVDASRRCRIGVWLSVQPSRVHLAAWISGLASQCIGN